MKIIFFVLSFLCATLSSFAQTKIKLTEVKDHIGDSITVEGSVSGTRYLESAERSPTFLNIGGVYPKNVLTIVIWGADRNKFSVIPEDAYKNKSIRITGKLLDYNGKPEIVVTDPVQIVLLDKK